MMMAVGFSDTANCQGCGVVLTHYPSESPHHDRGKTVAGVEGGVTRLEQAEPEKTEPIEPMTAYRRFNELEDSFLLHLRMFVSPQLYEILERHPHALQALGRCAATWANEHDVK